MLFVAEEMCDVLCQTQMTSCQMMWTNMQKSQTEACDQSMTEWVSHTFQLITTAAIRYAIILRPVTVYHALTPRHHFCSVCERLWSYVLQSHKLRAFSYAWSQWGWLHSVLWCQSVKLESLDYCAVFLRGPTCGYFLTIPACDGRTDRLTMATYTRYNSVMC